MKNKTYTKEFKKQAVELAESLGSKKAAARQLGVSDASIHNWTVQMKNGGKLSAPNPSLTPGEAEELRRLRKEVSDLKKVNQILKAAAAFFSQDHLK